MGVTGAVFTPMGGCGLRKCRRSFVLRARLLWPRRLHHAIGHDWARAHIPARPLPTTLRTAGRVRGVLHPHEHMPRAVGPRNSEARAAVAEGVGPGALPHRFPRGLTRLPERPRSAQQGLARLREASQGFPKGPVRPSHEVTGATDRLGTHKKQPPREHRHRWDLCSFRLRAFSAHVGSKFRTGVWGASGPPACPPRRTP